MAVQNDTYKKVIIIGIILSLFMQILAVSCNNDDDDNNNVTNHNMMVNGKYLVKINSADLTYNAQGQLAKVKFNNKNSGASDFDFSYEAKRIICGSPYDVIYYLKDGRITESRYTVWVDDGESTLTFDDKTTYEYDKNGYLTKQTGPKYDYSEEDTKPEITVYEWRDGNIQKIIRSENEYDEETTISYTSFANTIPDLSRGMIGNYLGWQGYFGKRCKNLPASETVNSPNDPFGPITYNYEYTYEDGLLKRVTVKWNYRGTPSTLVHELEWY